MGLGKLNPFRASSPLNPSNLIEGAGNIGQDVIDTAKDVGKSIDQTIREQLPGGWTTAALLAAGYYYSPEINAYISADGATMAAGADVAVADAAAATAAEQAAAAYAEQLAAEQAAIALATEQAAAAAAAEQLAAQIAAQNAAWDAAAIDLASSASPVFATSAAAQGLTLKQGLDAARAGLLVNAITGDPLGLNDVTGSGGNTFANQGFAQVPIPEDWKSPTYTYSPVQNVTFEDLFPGVSLQGTQWQNMPQAQTFNEMFASGQQQTPMGSTVDINQIVGSILGQSATS